MGTEGYPISFSSMSLSFQEGLWASSGTEWGSALGGGGWHPILSVLAPPLGTHMPSAWVLDIPRKSWS